MIKKEFGSDVPAFEVAISMSLVVFGFDGKKIQVLLTQKKSNPFAGGLMLPSKFLKPSDDLDEFASGLFSSLFQKQSEVSIEQLRVFGELNRHPKGRVLNVAFYALAKKIDFDQEKWKKYNLAWCPKNELPDLIFDHNEIVDYAEERLKRRVKRRPVGFHLLPEKFTLSQLQVLYESALDKTFDKRNFRKKLANTSLIIDLDKLSDGTPFGQKKGSKLYKFNSEEYQKMKMRGYDFSF